MKKFNILFFSSEPGGASILSPVIKMLKNFIYYNVTVLSYGNGILRFEAEDVNAISIPKIKKNDGSILDIYKPDLVITSAASLPHIDMSEKYLWEISSDSGITSIAFIDQWQNYSLRFSGIEQNEVRKYKPDYINCINKVGVDCMIAEGFEKSRLLSLGHPYLTKIQRDVFNIEKIDILKYLDLNSNDRVAVFASEAILENYGNDRGYDQYSVLNIFLEFACDSRRIDSVIIKLHPKDDPSKFGFYVKKYKKINIRIVHNELNSAQCLSVASSVYGMSSIFLIESFILQIPTISIQPNLVVEDPFVLSKIGLVRLATCVSDLKLYEREISDLTIKSNQFEFEFDKVSFLELIKNQLPHA